ncbi:MAG: hypothetical protein KDC10_11880, partial [Calditrichaeota bacterium]|nr:hypothetical protein [Calditrichota bacterium]
MRIVLALGLTAAGVAQAATVHQEAVPFQYDEEQCRRISDDGAGGIWGNTCWQGPVAGPNNKMNYHVGQGDLPTGTIVTLSDLFGPTPITMDDLESISFYTKKLSADSVPDN